MKTNQFRHFPRPASIGVALVLVIALAGAGHSQEAGNSATLQGSVQDANGQPVAAAVVHLESKDGTRTRATATDSSGNYRFSALPAGAYTLRAEKPQHGEAAAISLTVGQGELKTIDLALLPVKAPAAPNIASEPEFFDPPQFTVAGVTDTTSLGGHGSDAVVRNREALEKEARALGGKAPPALSADAGVTEKSLRTAVERSPGDFDANFMLGKWLAGTGREKEALPYLEQASRLKDDAESHHLLAEAEEKTGDPLKAVHEYQRAAELSPNESNLFDWGSELLLHRAPEPAIEVFVRGNRLFPTSVRMLIGLGVAQYARGATNDAIRFLCAASDLNPGDAAPYLFMGKIQASENDVADEIADHLLRFDELQPDNAFANYYYAVSLWKRRKNPQEVSDLPRVALLLEKAVRLDPNLAGAYLQFRSSAIGAEGFSGGNPGLPKGD